LGFSFNIIKNAAAINADTTPKLPALPSVAIINPPIAWPVTEAESHVPWFHVVAFCNKFLGTMLARTTPKIGPMNARIRPVVKMIT